MGTLLCFSTARLHALGHVFTGHLDSTDMTPHFPHCVPVYLGDAAESTLLLCC